MMVSLDTAKMRSAFFSLQWNVVERLENIC
jgi:hypothetical protein